MFAGIVAVATATMATFTTSATCTIEVLSVTLDLNCVSIPEAVLVTGVTTKSIFAIECVEIDASTTFVTAIGALADFKVLETTFLKAFTSTKFIDHIVNTGRAAIVYSGATLRTSFQTTEATLFAAN